MDCQKNKKTASIDGKAPRNRALLSFYRDEGGSMITFCVMMFGLMLAFGGLSFDLIRYEVQRERLQSTLDRAVLAAANLKNESADPVDVVMDYFAIAGMSEFIDPGDVTVIEEIAFRRVEATARIFVPLHHGTFNWGNSYENGGKADTLVAEATSVAQEGIGDVEIALVLDVSGSMNWYSRLTNLKTAAKGFLDTVYDRAEPDTVSTSIIPYAAQVNIGSEMLSHFARSDSHENSHCLNFATADFSNTGIPLLDGFGDDIAYEQTLQFDRWTSYSDYWWDVGEDLPSPTCPNEASQTAMLWSTDKDALKTYVDNLSANGNTSTDIGVKWGAFTLDPSSRDILNAMVGSGSVNAAIADRPSDYYTSDAMKVMVIMTDGEHTDQHYMEDYRDGDSFVWRYEDGDDLYYSIWHDGEGSEPNTNAVTETQSQYSHTEWTWVCTWWYWGYCYDGYWSPNYIYVDVEVEADNWYIVYNTDTDGYYSDTDYRWQSRPEGIDDGSTPAVRMTWDQVWAEIPLDQFAHRHLSNMGTLSWSERQAFVDAQNHVGPSSKDGRFDAICAAIDELSNGDDPEIIVFTIGLSVPSTTHEDRLQDCASTDANFYDVTALDLDEAFQNIAGQINFLRLIQ